MKNYPWIILSAGLLALAFAPQACGGGTNNGGGGATTTVTTGSTTHTTSLTTGTGGSGGALTCTDILDPAGACGACVDAKCCDQVVACANDSDCVDCFNGAAADPSICTASTVYQALYTCEQTNSCVDPCTPVPPTSACNPVTSAECTTAGDSCDLASDQTYQCFDSATEALCAACDYSTPKYCAPGMFCLADDTGVGQCARYCCADTDCGTGTCDKTNFPGGVGICVAAGDAGTPKPSCDAPKVSPSGGSCFSLTAADGG
jgi:hypothetical protein